jgi:antitoxin (DNA-binding transcriptional repressor) of toxin-antitoxin stability system
MKMMTVGELKANFSDVIELISSGKEVPFTYGKKKKVIGKVVPAKSAKKNNKVKLGIWKGKAKVTFAKDFKMTIDEFLNLKDPR